MKKTIFIIFFISVTALLSATDYYVKAGGNNSAAGTSDAAAWGTVAKVNSFSFSAGDHCYFRRGDSWIEVLSPSVSGTTSNPITFDAYGTGALPIIGGVGEVSGWNTAGNWTSQGNNLWSIPISGIIMSDIARIRIWLSNVEAKRSSTTSGVNSTTNFYCDGSVLWVYAASNPASAFSSVKRTGVYNGPLSIDSKNYLAFKNIDFRGGNWASITLSSCNYLTFDGCKIGLYVPASGISATNCGHGEVMNCTFDTGDRNMDAWEAENEEDGLHLHDGCNNWNVHNNVFKDWGHCCLLLWGDNSADMVTDINIYDNSFSDENTDYGSALTINGFTGGIARVHIYRNYMYKMGTNNQFCTDGELLFYENIIDGTKGNTYKPSKSGYGIACLAYGNEQGIGQKFYNNTVVNCLDGAVILINYATSAYVYNNEFINNIFANNGANNSNFQIYYGANSPSNGYYVLQNTFKNNLIYSSATSSTIYYGHSPSYPSGTVNTVAQFNTENGIQGDVISANISDNPLFVTSGDFHLQAGSPAIGKGLAIAAVTSDYAGSALANPPSIGAYENGSAVSTPVVPVYQSSAVANATPTILEMTYNMTLAGVVPAVSAFSVMVNSAIRTINTVAVSGTKVQLTLSTRILPGDLVTVSYVKPANNPLVTNSGGIASSIAAQPVINNCINAAPTADITSPVINSHPVVKILNPRKGNAYTNLSSVEIDATASDPDGTISKVEFYNGQVKLVELTSAPYTYIWKNVASGNYSIMAVATDNLSDTTHSTPVEFVVGAVTKYDGNSDVVKLFPNPNNGHFSIEFINPLQSEKSEIIITDMAGKQVYDGSVLKEDIAKQFDLSNSKSGLYVMIIKDKEILVTKKFIIK